jgi:ligand-binding sensor domain-containing protein
MDQNNNPIIPSTIHTIAQDYNNVIWVGTGSGIFAIPAGVDFATSNKCIRVIIPRNDGTQLGDYLLDNEQINDIKIDGGNRLWVGTANSGVFLLKPVSEYVEDPSYYVETVAHFTTENSILPTNDILSIAIQESTGEVFFATSGGLVSYMSDATPANSNYSQIYAYPNPVRPNYRGQITFKGLMNDTELRIVDGSGNLIKTIYSEGGTAIWDATNTRGDRVASGVYTAICNTSDGQHNGAVKVMIFH